MTAERPQGKIQATFAFIFSVICAVVIPTINAVAAGVTETEFSDNMNTESWLIVLGFALFAVSYFFHGSVAGLSLFSCGFALNTICLIISIPDFFDMISSFIKAEAWNEPESLSFVIAQAVSLLFSLLIIIYTLIALLSKHHSTLGIKLFMYLCSGFASAGYIAFFIVCTQEMYMPDDKMIFVVIVFFTLIVVNALIPWIITMLITPYIRLHAPKATQYNYNPAMPADPTGYTYVAPAGVFDPAPVAPVNAAPVEAVPFPVAEDSGKTEVLAEPIAPINEAPLGSAAESLLKLKKLFDAGLMTEEEYNAKRDEIIARM
ncbi:MAG: SHOCT domain-containing protein [Ruminococcaceae bacterium]|nr:SHOCT domain-containing protein [Oscillospiraceae bacterium]